MILSWSVLALALIGAEDQQPSQPKSPGSSVAIEIDGGGCKAIDSASCRRAATAIAAKPAGQKPKTKPGTFAKVANLCAKLYLAYLIDEVKAACPEIGEAPAPPATTHPTASPKPLSTATALPKLDDPEAEMWPMTLDDAIRIALDNSEVVRVIAFGGGGLGAFHVPTALEMGTSARKSGAKPPPIVIARINSDTNLWRFKAEVMAMVRSVEQSYWNLAQAHVQLWAADRAVSMAQEILEREQAELVGRGTVADVAEAAQRLEQFNLDMVTRTSDVITAERQLRIMLGQSHELGDDRRIIPVTPPAEARLEPDWDSSLAQMLSSQPDIVQQKLLVRVAELQLLIARNQLLPTLSLNALDQLNALGQHWDGGVADKDGMVLRLLQQVTADQEKSASLKENLNQPCFLTQQDSYTFQIPMATGRSPLANTRQAQYALLRSRAYLHQVVHQTTHSLARFFLEIDANYKQFKTASRLRAAAAQRLDAQRAYYEEGRITIDRFLDAVSQYTTAVATEAQYKATYNIAIVALEEAKGTLLDYDNILVAEGPRPRKAYKQASQPRRPFHVQAAAPGQGVKPTPPRWAEVTQITRRMAKRDRQAMPAALGPDPTHGVEVPRVTPLTEVSPVPRMVPVPESAAAIWPRTPSHASDPVATDVAGKANEPAKANAKAKARTWTFDISIGGADPIRIKGTIRAMEDEAPGRSDEP